MFEGLRWWGVAAGIAIAALAAVPGGLQGIAALGAAAVVATLALVWFRAWLGGVTGDALGATAKLCETAALVAFVAAA